MKSQILIGIAEDHDLVRVGLISLLKGQNRIKVALEASNGEDLLDKLKTTKPDVLLLDIEMPLMNGKEAFAKIKEKYPNMRVIVVSAHYQDSHIIEFVKKGINGFLAKNCSLEKLVETIYAVHEKEFHFDSQISILLAKELANPNETINEIQLSEKENNIIRLICQHKTNKEIGDILSLSSKTIEFHRSKIMRKTKSKNLAALIEYAIKKDIFRL